MDDLAAKVRAVDEPFDVVYGRLRAALRTARAEMALYTARFRDEHHDNEDTRQSWEGLVWYVTEGWPPPAREAGGAVLRAGEGDRTVARDGG